MKSTKKHSFEYDSQKNDCRRKIHSGKLSDDIFWTNYLKIFRTHTPVLVL